MCWTRFVDFVFVELAHVDGADPGVTVRLTRSTRPCCRLPCGGQSFKDTHDSFRRHQPTLQFDKSPASGGDSVSIKGN